MLRAGTISAIVAVAALFAALPATAGAKAPALYRTGTDVTDNDAVATATCPEGTKIAGGGGSISFPQAIIHAPFLNSSGPLANTWKTYGYYASGDETVTSYASCLRKTVGRPKVTTASVQLAAGENASTSAECPQGTRVTGGGAIVSGPVAEAALSSSFPIDRDDQDLDNDDGWHALAISQSTNELTLNVYALCMRRGRSALRYRQDGFDGPTAAQDCPGKSRVLSGGWSGNVAVHLVTTRPADGDDDNDATNDAWELRLDSDDSDLYGGNVYAVCIKP